MKEQVVPRQSGNRDAIDKTLQRMVQVGDLRRIDRGLYWAGRSAMRVVQALYGLKDTLASDRDRILGRLTQVLADPAHGVAIRQDLMDGFSAMPAWMQSMVRELPGCDPQNAAAKTLQALGNVKPPATRGRSVKRMDVTE